MSQERGSKRAKQATMPSTACVYQGVPGCFSEKAAMQWLKESRESPTPDDLRGVSSFEAVFAEVEADRAFFGILPIENSSSGSLHQVYDCLLKSPLNIVGELGMVEEHCLVGKAADKSEVTEVRGHPHILDACSQYLGALGDANEKGSSSSGGGGKSGNIGVACVPALNSASACLELASQPSSVAAIAPREAAALYHLRVIESGIANDSNVETRYVVVGKHKIETLAGLATGSRAYEKPPMHKTSVVCLLPNTSGAIFKIVAQFATRDLNIVKLETRPACSGGTAVYSSNPKHWDLLFYIDFEASPLQATNDAVMGALREFSVWMRELGTYRTCAQDKLEMAQPS